MTKRLLLLRFDGTRYHGWQVQPNAVTVQETVQNALEALTGTRPGVTGCSRTDAGVHAEMFCCTFASDSRLSDAAWLGGLNAHLPRDIAAYACCPVPEEFHPRYTACGKRYTYRVWNSRIRHPFWTARTAQITVPLDAQRLQAAAQNYLGTHDFAAFCAAGSSVEDTVRTVSRFTVERERELVSFTVEADGFLYNMVRIMVGTLLDMAQGRRDFGGIPRILASRDRGQAGRTAPAAGLTLERVFYPAPWDRLGLNGDDSLGGFI